MTATPAPPSAGDRQPTTGVQEGEEPPHRQHAEADPHGKRLLVLSLTALGVVYGDIGTSPLYAIKEAFKPEYGLVPNIGNVYGLLSLIVWVLVLIVSVKYVAFILRADNRGEGGVLALLALILQRIHRQGTRDVAALLIALGLFGGAFLYGDGVITPAISVLGAVEGLEVASPALTLFVIPLAFIIIAALFWVQKNGTAKVGWLFGWIMLVWFATIAALGVCGITSHPEILSALNPWHAVQFFCGSPGSVVHRARRGRTRDHRWRSTLRRHGSFRPEADPPRLVLVRASGAAVELLRSGRAPAPLPNRGLESVLPAGAELVRVSPAGRRDVGRGRRVSGTDLRRVLAHPAGDSARVQSAHADHSHVEAGSGTDLHPRSEQGAGDRHACCSWSGSDRRPR